MSKENFYSPLDKRGSRVEFRDGSWVELVDFWGSSYRVVQAARVSYNNDDRSKGYKKDLELLQKLMNDGHLGPFEHVGATVRIYTPIFIARQIMRHRTASYNEISRRYTKSGIDFWIPPKGQIRFVDEKWSKEVVEEVHKIITENYSRNYADYQKLLELGIVKEQARAILPVGLMTKFYMTANLRNWLHFLDLRKNSHAQFEAQEIASGVEQLLSMVFEDAMEAWRNSKTRGWW